MDFHRPWFPFRIVLLGLAFVLPFPGFTQSESDRLLARLDSTIDQAYLFLQQKESTLEALKKQESRPGLSDEARFRFHSRLMEAFRLYRFDSALHYVHSNLDLAERTGRMDWKRTSVLQLSQVLISGGMYKEAVEALSRLRPEELNHDQKVEYYHNQKLVYEALKEYAQEVRFSPLYAEKARLYQDSLLALLKPESDLYRIEHGIRMMQEGRLDAAEAELLDYFRNRVVPGTSPYAGISAVLSYLYKLKGKPQEERKFRILSAIADIQAVVKENTSLTELAVRLYEEGQIDRANAYIGYALEDANFFNARQRKIEIAKIYPIITHAYQMERQRQQDQLQLYLVLITGVSALLLLAILVAYRQNKKLDKARGYLHSLNQEMQKVNADLQDLNRKLREANFIKEEYIGHFLNQCSAYIEKLETYQKKVHRLLAARQLNELQRLSESPDLIKAELAEFYTNFDQAFLRLFPHFVEEMNQLLDPSQPLLPRKGELLNTELRIFALIRLGITDSYKIAHFLRYSPNTIYNYRAQIKNRALVDREQFEKRVMRIGSGISLPDSQNPEKG